MPVPLRFPIVDGRIPTASLEAHIVDHCNLRCDQCCSLSPQLPAYEVDPEQLARDLSWAHQVLAPSTFKLVGGEPLLHSRLVECLEVARRSAIAPMVLVTTNALRIHRVDPEFWRLVDGVTVSAYPTPGIPTEIHDHIMAKASEHRVVVNWKVQSHFVAMDRSSPQPDAETTAAIYDDCWLRRRCHTLRDGRLFACPRPIHLRSVHPEHVADDDGVELRPGPTRATQVQAYLERLQPLRTCQMCHGARGALVPHRQLATRPRVRPRP
ncbi:MAG: radical SAM protein [Deltaproteobacteria bacterium]|nr:radical SAM protein [Deltaproteobacteria bacterium]